MISSFVHVEGSFYRGAIKRLDEASPRIVPRSQNGFTIITSRSREVALKMVKHTDLIQVNSMERTQALELLQKTLDQTGESQEGQQLVDHDIYHRLNSVNAKKAW